MILPLVLAVTATFSPAQPTVGDRITLVFPAPVAIDKSQEYEVVESAGRRVVVRTFLPKPIVLSGTMRKERFRGVTVPVESVLKENDDLKPAPLAPPRELPYPRAPFIAIGIAAVAAIAAWLLVWRFARKAVETPDEPVIPADERFRQAVAIAKAQPERWAALADATRTYLAATRPRLGSDLTTTELVPRLQEDERVVFEILRQGDLEKFSVDGAEPEDFDDVAKRALELAS
ncbi:MAG TPA: hypothetical protein VEU30_08120 [Thermoanaerobaculia bacterium]|nr:hypothetical protein [Thermoanaerobaculia bacterium]